MDAIFMTSNRIILLIQPFLRWVIVPRRPLWRKIWIIVINTNGTDVVTKMFMSSLFKLLYHFGYVFHDPASLMEIVSNLHSVFDLGE